MSAATTTRSHSAGPPAAAQQQDPRRWWILVVLGVAQLMVVLDSTIVNIALPSAQTGLGFDDDGRQWIVTAYSLAFGSLLLLGGRLADRFGRKRMFLIGLAGFAVASAVGGAATGFGMLVAARAVQGAFGAILAPAGLSLLTTTFTDGRERSKAFGIYGAIAGGGAAIGLLLGGVLTQYLSWRWCMYVNVAFAAVSLIGGALWLKHRPVENRGRIDVVGVGLITAGLFALVYGLAHAESAGWADPVTIGFIVAGAVLLVVFVGWQGRAANPVLPLRIVLDRNRGGSYLAIFATGIGLFGLSLFLTYYLQQSLGFSAVQAGLAFLPMTAALVLTSQISSNLLTSRIGPRYIIAPGLALSAVGLWMLTALDGSSTYLDGVLAAIIVFGAGIGLTVSAAISTSTAGVPAADAGVASAMVSTAQQVGGSIGTAVLSTVVASSAAGFAALHASTPRVAELAAIHGYTSAFWWSAAVLAGGAVVTAVLLRGRVARDPAPSEPVAAR